MEYEWFHPAGLRPDLHYGVPLLISTTTGLYLLLFWNGDSFYELNSGRQISHTIVRWVAMIHPPQLTEEQEEKLGNKIFNIDDEEHKPKGYFGNYIPRDRHDDPPF